MNERAWHREVRGFDDAELIRCVRSQVEVEKAVRRRQRGELPKLVAPRRKAG